MLTGSAPKSEEKAGLVDLETIRRNLKKWAAKKNGLWLGLSDEELEDLLGEVSQIKRFLERYCADQNFREELFQDPHQAIKQYNLCIDPEDFRVLWKVDIAQESATKTLLPIPESLKHFFEFARERLHWQELKDIASSSSNPYFKAWRKRQIAGTQFQFADSVYENIPHIPVCFELSKGCSVGCHFCAISAPRLGDIFLYTQENAKLWHQTLEFMRKTLGTAASAGFCYWATDPLDNPDYEKFMTDFHEILGVFPQTTTAQPIKDPNRMRSLLKLSLEKGCKLNRFSILSLKMLDRVYEIFSAEELAFVGLVPQNSGSRVLTQQFPLTTEPAKKINAGRTLERNQKRANSSDSDFYTGTIACVTGFLFNMVERSVKLISPCNADESWPLGYIIFDEGTFSDIDELKTVIENMIAKNMPLTVRNEDLVKFRDDLEYGILPDGFKLWTKWKTLSFRNRLTSVNIPQFQSLGQLVSKGDKTAGEIADIFARADIPASKTLEYLNVFFNKGVLDDHPKLKNSAMEMPEEQKVFSK